MRITARIIQLKIIIFLTKTTIRIRYDKNYGWLFLWDIVYQINIARKCGMVYFLSTSPTFPPTSLKAIDGSNLLINEARDFVKTDLLCVFIG